MGEESEALRIAKSQWLSGIGGSGLVAAIAIFAVAVTLIAVAPTEPAASMSGVKDAGISLVWVAFLVFACGVVLSVLGYVKLWSR